MENILEVNQIKKYYKIKTGLLQKTQKITTTISDDISRSVCIIESDANGWRYHFRTYFKL
ncbi:oligopeptide ABC superfamily ATP binding cassette transporter%2C ABC protein [Staphylococcus aureus]|nr:oligopeptide ABC superfamily ATP binding cassette transporter%2C ABC protein [Staphylococcus aureus]